jgi:hypothetical protein
MADWSLGLTQDVGSGVIKSGQIGSRRITPSLAMNIASRIVHWGFPLDDARTPASEACPRESGDAGGALSYPRSGFLSGITSCSSSLALHHILPMDCGLPER